MSSVVENFTSFLWTDRYSENGEFELYLPPSIDAPSQYGLDWYIISPESEHAMIIESVLLEADDNGYSYKVSGRSLESILSRRIPWREVTLSGNFQTEIKRLITENIISPSDSSRRIDNFVFVDSSDPEITKLTIDAKYSPDNNVYDIIQTNCQDFQIGFKVVLTSDNKFAFSLYKGTDRSYSQTILPYVIFSPDFDNLTNSSFLKSNKDLKNVALVGGDGDWPDKTTAVVGTATGLDRREIYVDGPSSSEGEVTVAQLQKKGQEELADYKSSDAFEGEANAYSMFVYGVDFFIGDTVQLEDAFGNAGKGVVSEMVFSIDEEGEKVYPTFVAAEEKEGE